MFDSVKQPSTWYPAAGYHFSRYLHQLESHPSWPWGPRESGDAPRYYRRRPRLAAPYGKVNVEKVWDENRFLTLTLPFHCMIWKWYESFWVWYNGFYNYFILGRSSNYQRAWESGASWMIYGWFTGDPYDIRDIRMIYGWYMDPFGRYRDDLWMIYSTDDFLRMIHGKVFCMISILYLFAWALFKTFKNSEPARPLGRFRSRGLESKVVNSTLGDGYDVYLYV